jgi:hypothetical protein
VPCGSYGGDVNVIEGQSQPRAWFDIRVAQSRANDLAPWYRKDVRHEVGASKDGNWIL